MADTEHFCGSCRMGAHRSCRDDDCVCRRLDAGAHPDLSDIGPDTSSRDPLLQWRTARPVMARERLAAVLALAGTSVLLLVSIARDLTPGVDGRVLLLAGMLSAAVYLLRHWVSNRPDPLLVGGR